MSEIARLRELLAKATTPGRWAVTTDGIVPEADDGGPDFCAVANNAEPDDAALIVAAVNALPALLDRLEAAERVVAAARAIDRAYSEGGSLGDTFRATAALHAALRHYDEVRRG